MILREEHELIRKTIKDFVEREMDVYPDEVDTTGTIPQEAMKKLGKYKFLAPVVPKEYGGGGADYLSYAIIMEELSRRCASTGAYLTATAALYSLPLVHFGTEEQKIKYLKPVCEGEKIGCFGLTEPGAGSDAGAGQTTAVDMGDYYLLNGRKCFITNAPIADFAIVSAMTNKSLGSRGISTFIVETDSEGFSYGAHEDKMGIRGSETADLIFENVKVPKSNLLGKEGQGFKIMLNTLDYGRICVAAQSLGVAQSALDEAVKYTKQRVQFGKPIAKFQNTQFNIADMATKVQAARLLVYDAAITADTGKAPGLQSSMAKYYASETANEVAYKALQMHGGYGYIKDYKIERIFRDARILSIYEGTSEIQKMVIGSHVLK